MTKAIVGEPTDLDVVTLYNGESEQYCFAEVVIEADAAMDRIAWHALVQWLEATAADMGDDPSDETATEAAAADVPRSWEEAADWSLEGVSEIKSGVYGRVVTCIWRPYRGEEVVMMVRISD